MTHEQFRELLPLYVIGALDGEEVREFEDYVATNRERCATEIAEFQNVADQLPFGAPPAQPSAEVFERVTAVIEEQPPAPVRRARFNWSVLFFRWIPWAATAVAMVLVVITTGQLRQARQQYREQLDENARQNARISELNTNVEAQGKQFQEEADRLHAANTTLQQDVDALKTANAKLSAEKAELTWAATEFRQQAAKQNQSVVSLQQSVDAQTKTLGLVMDPAIRVEPMFDPKQQTKAMAKIYWHDAKKAGVLVASNLAPVVKGEGKCLELWAICGNEPPVPAGLFWTDASGHGAMEIKLAKEMACVDKFAVTVESAGGVSAPAGPMILIGP